MLKLPVPLMALTLLVVVASQIPKVEDDLGRVAEVIPIYVAFLLVMALIGRAAARLFALDAADGRALVFSGATRNSLVVLPLAWRCRTSSRLRASLSSHRPWSSSSDGDHFAMCGRLLAPLGWDVGVDDGHDAVAGFA